MSTQIHPTAIVSPKAEIGRDCIIGPYSVIHDSVVLASNSRIGAYCELGHPSLDEGDERLVIDEYATIRSHTTIYRGCTIGDHFQTGHRVTIREGTQVGRYVSFGTLSDIQGHCFVGSYTRLHSNVHIGQKSHIDELVWIFPYTVLTNDPHPPSHVLDGVYIETMAVISTMVTILPGIRVGAEALVGAMSLVNREVKAETVVFGSPAKERGSVAAIKDANGERVYPWFPRLQKRYPVEAVDLWRSYQQARIERQALLGETDSQDSEHE